MATNQEKRNVGTLHEKRDYEDGWDKGYSDPYYPKAREETVLANIEKASPAFVKGYKRGRYEAYLHDVGGGCEWYPYTGPRPE